MSGYYERVDLGTCARRHPPRRSTYRIFNARKVDSAYAEAARAGVRSRPMQPAGLQRLELSAAVRYDKYSDVGKTTNPKIGVNWSPVQHLKCCAAAMARRSARRCSRKSTATARISSSSHIRTRPPAVRSCRVSRCPGGNLAASSRKRRRPIRSAPTWDPTARIFALQPVTYWHVDYTAGRSTPTSPTSAML